MEKNCHSFSLTETEDFQCEGNCVVTHIPSSDCEIKWVSYITIKERTKNKQISWHDVIQPLKVSFLFWNPDSSLPNPGWVHLSLPLQQTGMPLMCYTTALPDTVLLAEVRAETLLQPKLEWKPIFSFYTEYIYFSSKVRILIRETQSLEELLIFRN